MHCSPGTPAAAVVAAAVVEQLLTQQLPVLCVVAAEGENRKQITMHQFSDDTVNLRMLLLQMISSAVPTSNSCLKLQNAACMKLPGDLGA
jgi:hypothetical protein